MFDIGFLELIIIGIVALIVVGPKDLPGMFRQAGRFMGKMRAMAREFQRSMEEAADDSGLKEAASALRSTNDLGLTSATRSAQNYAKKMLDETEKASEPETEPSADGSPPKTAPDASDSTKPSGDSAPPAQEPAAAQPDKQPDKES